MANDVPSGSAVEVQDSPENSQFEATIDGGRVGVAAYALDGGVITFTHTEVDSSAEGKGVGSALAQTALDAARARGLQVVPKCAFIARYISRHEEYVDLVPPAQRELVERHAG
jgi:predicted GNAT family acetyltransferase